ncbi:MAG: hypothetical protein J6581_10115, partial [Apibacter sp.]|uniref:Uncharacterized protein n=1 Tax=Apibacter mensalis TaxID=1586267 RepID=A0A0X3ASR0_9FLAO|nr:hypothetical protein [Apibacter mensalis]MCO6565775.1 hypothetical protein [Apibacter sp.]CVK17263.1 hypothetical protein Ga0061079_1362 [Apibacter mensalis]
MENTEIRVKILLSIQRALLGMIYSSIRAIAVGFEKTEKLKVIYYLDKKPTEDDYDSISEVTTEVLADIDFSEVEEKCIFTLEPISKLDKLNSWVYMRKEL